MDFILGLGLALPITAASGVSVVTGVAEGVSHQQKVNEEAKSETRSLKFHVDARIDPATAAKNKSRAESRSTNRKGDAGGGGGSRVDVEGGILVLRNDRVRLRSSSHTIAFLQWKCLPRTQHNAISSMDHSCEGNQANVNVQSSTSNPATPKPTNPPVPPTPSPASTSISLTKIGPRPAVSSALYPVTRQS